MKVPDYKKLHKGDMPGMHQSFYKFADVVQEQLDLVSRAVNSRLTIPENVRSEPPTEAKMVHGMLYTIKLRSLKTSPSAVLIAHSDETVTGFQWMKADQQRIYVRALFDGAPVDPVRVTLWILG